MTDTHHAFLNNARAAKKDEFYTRYEDISKEIEMYPRSVFEGKRIYCPCDRADSMFRKYFIDHFDDLGLAELRCTYYDEKEPVKMFHRVRGHIAIDYQISTNGDFRSKECRGFLDECDIVVTNFPFSIFRELCIQVLEAGKGLLVIGNQTAIRSNDLFPYFMRNELWLGPSIRQGDMMFRIPEDYPTSTEKIEERDGVRYVHVNGVRWFTNLDRNRCMKDIVLCDRDPSTYTRFDTYDAINVDSVNDIPKDYDGIMGVPVTFINRHDPSRFEIVGKLDTGRISDFNFGQPIVNGKLGYTRFLIRHRN